MQTRWGLARCCCGCVLGADAFESGDALSAKWTGDTSDFTKSSGIITATAAAKMIRHVAANANGTDKEFTVKARMKGSNASDVTRLIGHYYDASSYVFAELAHAATPTLKLYQRKGGTNTQIGFTRNISGKTTGDWILARLCVYNDTGYAEALTTSGSTVASGALVTTPPWYAGGYAGLATSSMAGTASFDDFEFAQNRNSKAGCPQCDACDSGEFADAFSIEEFGWSQPYSLFGIAGGRMTPTSQFQLSNYRCAVRPALSIGAVVEQSVSCWYNSGGVGYASAGIYLNTTPGGPNSSTLRLVGVPAFGGGTYQRVVGSTLTTISQVPVDGDTLTIRATLSQVSPQKWDVEWLINGVVKDSQAGVSVTFTDPFYHSLQWAPTGGAVVYPDFDDYSLTITD